MDEYKDVMLSEPPSRFAAAPAVQAMSLENYKGILLCDRPAVNNRAAQDSVAPFLPAGRGADDRYIGLQPSHEARARLELCRSMRESSKIEKPSALTKHKKWLRSFATAVKQLKMDQVEDQLDGEQKAARLREKLAAGRQARAVAVLQKETEAKEKQQDGPALSSVTESKPPACSNPTAVTASSLVPAEEARPSGGEAPQQPAPAKPSHKQGKHKKPKPQWAMTEDEAFDAEMSANQDLIEFAQQLDYDQFINDYEVKEALAIMRDRVKEIADEQGMDLSAVAKKDEDGGDDEHESIPESEKVAQNATEVAAHKKTQSVLADHKKQKPQTAEGGAAEHPEDWDNSVNVADKLRAALSKDALQLAEKILSTSEAMRQIHSKQSLAMLLQEVTVDTQVGRKRATATVDRAAAAAAMPPVPPTEPPKVSTYAPESQPQSENQPTMKRILTEMRKSKTRVQNLPYMYRCPSI